MARYLPPAALLAALLAATPAWAAVTDDDVQRAIAKGREYLINQQNPDGSFGKDESAQVWNSLLAFMTLGYLCEHPNHDPMSKGFAYVAGLGPKDFDACRAGHSGLAAPARMMGLAFTYLPSGQDRRVIIKKKMKEDLQALQARQNDDGGWACGADKTSDVLATTWHIEAMRRANRTGLELPIDVLTKARDLLFSVQKPNGSWGIKADAASPASEAMTAAAAGSLAYLADLFELASVAREMKACQHAEAALGWLDAGHKEAAPLAPESPEGKAHGLWCLERAGLEWGRAWFGFHDWFREVAESLVRRQAPDGSWGNIEETCFALRFLYDGGAQVVFEKLRFDGNWNNRPRDVSALTDYSGRDRCSLFNWQVVDLAMSLEEMHVAPVIYVSLGSLPKLTAAEKQKLRAFTDSGGTILVSGSGKGQAARNWAVGLARDVWPEWPLQRLPKDHTVFTMPYPLVTQPETWGADDHERTFLYFVPEDLSQSWQGREYASKEYLFKWAGNLYVGATDRAPLRSRLAKAPPDKLPYPAAIKPGPRPALKLARLKHGGDWWVGANYGAFPELAKRLKEKAGISLDVTEPRAAPVTEGGVEAKDLKGFAAAFMTGTGELVLSQAEKDALKAYVAGGGLVWVEAARGAEAFDKAFRDLAKELGWEVRLLEKDDPLMTGKLGAATGYDLTQGVDFRLELKKKRLGKKFAEFHGLFVGQKMVGVYSPYDILFSSTPYQASGCLGYKADDANAVATSILLWMTR